MELTSDEFFERLLLSYSDYFDIIRDTSYKDLSVAAEAAFHSFSGMSWSKKLSCGPLKLTNMSSLTNWPFG